MKWGMVLALVVSLGANAVLGLRGTRGAAAGEELRPAPAAPPSATPAKRAAKSPPAVHLRAPSDVEMETARVRVVELKDELVRLRARLLQVQGIPVAVRIAQSASGMADKLRAIGELPAEDWENCLAALSRRVDHDDALRAELVEVILCGTDACALRVACALLHAHPTFAATEGHLAKALARLRAGTLPEQRVLAAYVVGESAREPAAEWLEPVAAAIRTDPDPRVAPALTHGLRYRQDGLPRPIVSAFLEWLDRFGSGEGRGEVQIALGTASLAADGGAGLFDRWRRAGTPELRQEIAVSLVWSGLIASVWGRSAVPAARRAERSAELSPCFFEMYAQTEDAYTRSSLAEVAWGGLYLTDPTGPGAARFVRQLAEHEVDGPQHGRLLALADAVEQGLSLDTRTAVELLRGR